MSLVETPKTAKGKGGVLFSDMPAAALRATRFHCIFLVELYLFGGARCAPDKPGIASSGFCSGPGRIFCVGRRLHVRVNAAC